MCKIYLKMALNPFEAVDMKNYESVETDESSKENPDLVPQETLQNDVTSQASPAVTPVEVEEKRKMWQIFTDKDGEQQRNAVPLNEGQEVDQSSATLLSAGSRVVVKPRKPPRDTQVMAGANGSVDTVVFAKDSTYVAFTSVDVESEDDELFGGNHLNPFYKFFHSKRLLKFVVRWF